MNRQLLLGTILSAALVTGTAGAMAADTVPGMSSGTTKPESATVAEPNRPDAAVPRMNDSASVMAPKSAIGTDVMNADGERIGVASGTDGSRVIVSVGTFLGVGAREVALNWNELTTTGTGAAMKLHTTLNEDELMHLPEYTVATNPIVGDDTPKAAVSAENGMSKKVPSEMPATVATHPAKAPASAVGRDIYNAKGDKIGNISKIAGEQVIISVGGFLGMGTHNVALDWNNLTTTGSGNDAKLHSPLSSDELKKLPKYKG